MIVDQSQQNPGPRISHAMVWDSTRERMILFAGTDLDRYFDDTWAFDGSTSQWVRLDTIGNPPPRSQHGILALGRSFQVEMESGGLEALRLYPGSLKSVYVGKLIANLAVLLAMELLLIPLSAVLFNVDLWSRIPALLGVAALGSLGFTAVGTFYAALTANLRARDVMLPLLLFPIQVPVVVAAVRATALVVRGDPMGELLVWVRILALVDLVLLTVCLLTFEYALEE